MKRQMTYRVVGLVLLLMGCRSLAAQERSAYKGATRLAPNTPDEPLRNEYSAQAAVGFLDALAQNWQREQKCFVCHTGYAYLLARPAVAWDVPACRQIRSAAERMAEQDGLQAKEPGRSSEAVLLAAALAMNDAQTTHTLHPATRRALDRMWTLQRDDGSWQWPIQCKWPPSEIDEHFGVATAALAVGAAPGGYCQTPQAKQGLEKIRRFFVRNPPATTYQRGMLLWVSRYVDGILSEPQRKAAIEELLSLQRPDGGWAFASLGNWQRSDGKPQDRQTSDGYGTGFAVYVLRTAGLPSQQPQIQKGIHWLKTHQRASGRWFTRSANKDSQHFVTHEGTAFALMALAPVAGEHKPNSNYTPSRNLSRFFAKIKASQPVVVMGIGGSVTEGHSWAAMSAEWLQKQYPGKQIFYVDGAYGGTPPWQTVFRLRRDILPHKPDMVFIEYAVNSYLDNERNWLAEDGMIQQLLRQPQQPEIVFVYAGNDKGARDLEKVQPVARHYGFLEVDVRSHLQKKIDAGEVAWKDIAGDAIHPNQRGHAIYAEAVTALLTQQAALGKPAPAVAVPSPFFGDEFTTATLLSIDGGPEKQEDLWGPWLGKGGLYVRTFLLATSLPRREHVLKLTVE